MRIGVLGSGEVGRTLGAGFLRHGHEVMLGTREPGRGDVADWVGRTPGARAGAFDETARFGETIVLACLGRAVEDVIRLAQPTHLAGKTVIDTTNPIAGEPPEGGVLRFFTGPNDSLGERVQALLPGARVVKAFNSVGSPLMVEPRFAQGTPTMFLCGDSGDAKAQVALLIRQLGWEPYDCGGIVAARALEPLCMLWCLPGLLRNEWGHAFRMLTE